MANLPPIPRFIYWIIGFLQLCIMLTGWVSLILNFPNSHQQDTHSGSLNIAQRFARWKWVSNVSASTIHRFAPYNLFAFKQKNTIPIKSDDSNALRRIPERIPFCRQCRVIKKLGQGGYGKVYQVRFPDLRQNEISALKVFVGKHNEVECKLEKAVLRYIGAFEGESGELLQIAHVREDIKGVTCPNLALEFIHGQDINNTLNYNHSMPSLVNMTVSMMKQIGFGVLDRLHAINIYHNDVKPENIIFDAHKNKYYLIDFGLCVPLSILHWPECQAVDIDFYTTLPFMSPWHVLSLHHRNDTYKISNDDRTQRSAANSDFWSLGLTAIIMIGKNCNNEKNDDLCKMAKQILWMKENNFLENEIKEFVLWDAIQLRQRLTPYWETIEHCLEAYIRVNSSANIELMSLLSDLMLRRHYRFY